MDKNQQQIKTSGLRVTPTRTAVMHILNSSNKPLDIATIYKEISNHHVDADQATIYRIIENFIEKGLISRIQLRENKFYYEKKGKEHHHVVCTNCNNIEDVSNCNIKSLVQEIEIKYGFEVKSHSLEFFGLCNNCK